MSVVSDGLLGHPVDDRAHSSIAMQNCIYPEVLHIQTDRSDSLAGRICFSFRPPETDPLHIPSGICHNA